MAPVSGLFTSFSNAEVARATGIDNLAGFRKNLEFSRDGLEPLALMPRPDPDIKLAHVYSYALQDVISKSMTRIDSHHLLYHMHLTMLVRANDRLAQLSEEQRAEIVAFYQAKDRAGDFHHTLQLFVDFPWLAYDPELLDRSEERQKNPVLWCYVGGKCFQAEALASVGEVYERIAGNLTPAEKEIFGHSGFTARNPLVVINVTQVLTEIDKVLSACIEVRTGSRRARS